MSENDISVVFENDFLICEACLARKILTLNKTQTWSQRFLMIKSVSLKDILSWFPSSYHMPTICKSHR